jgi:DNA invertase Pin-like site-specific DNA recombinase
LNSPGWATYLRVSDEDKQTPERSFAMQRQRIQEHLLASSDIPFKREYTDMLTGTTPNRADYQQMLKDAEAGKFSHLGLYRADRFGRNTVEGLQAATRLIGLGVKIRVAHMPSLRPEEPDGFFMFLIQMGLAQREVEVLKQRSTDGMEAKMRAGGWAHKAPEGYENKERMVKSNKYERWVEPDPIYFKVIREAWDLLLTDRYTLAQICEELTNRGYTRSTGRPWAWDNTRTGERKTAENRLHIIFHTPFYTGWVVSEKFGIKLGEIRGSWEPLVTTEEYQRGIEILRAHDTQKSRVRSCFYLLRGLLWIRNDGKIYKMYGSTPKGRSQSYAYYITHAKPDGKKIHLPCKEIDSQIPGWMQSIQIEPTLLPALRDIYYTQIMEVTQSNHETKLKEMKRQLTGLREEEARLGRLYITGKIGEETYEQLRKEWQIKLRKVEINISDMERESRIPLDDLNSALLLIANISSLYTRLKESDRAKILQIIAKRIIVNLEGEIIDHELHSPFAYLRRLVDEFQITGFEPRGSEQLRFGALRIF